jgi:hypothetical protein
VESVAPLPRGGGCGIGGVVGGMSVVVVVAVAAVTGHVEVNVSKAARYATIGPYRANLPRMLDWHWTRAMRGLDPGETTWVPTLLLLFWVFLQSPYLTLIGVDESSVDRAGAVSRAERGIRSNYSCAPACCFCVMVHGGRSQQWSAFES